MEKLLKTFLVCLTAVIVGNVFIKIIDVKFDILRQESNKNNMTNKMSLDQRERQLECLARNIYFEAANEHFEGKVAVAQVTLNRAESGMFPSDICKVIYQKNIFYEKVICQFSWYCDNAAKKQVMNTNVYNECMAVAKKVLLEGFRLDGLTEAMYYHANYVNPKWKKEKIITIGNHIFYK